MTFTIHSMLATTSVLNNLFSVFDIFAAVLKIWNYSNLNFRTKL